MKHIQKDPSTKDIREVFLRNIGVKSIQDINGWYLKVRNQEYTFETMQSLIDFVMQYQDKQIVICGDYDADGVTATAIMVRTLKELGFQNVSYMIPDRSEGYGMNLRMVEEISKTRGNNEDICLILVDNGIMAHEPIELAKNFGMSVVVLDHHLGMKDENGNVVLPCADVIVNPSALDGTATFNGYCGAGLAYRFATMTLDDTKALMPMATIATFADVMPLREENYVIAKEGLKLLNKGIGPEGLLALIEASGIEFVDEQTVLYKIGPVLNAPGRIKPNGAMQAVELLLTESGFEAEKVARELIAINEKRISMVETGMKRLESQISEISDIIIEYVPKTHQGIAGILAGKITEAHNRPSIVLTDNQDNPDLLVGSARSVDGLHIKNTLDAVSQWLVSYGGHEGAAGLSVNKKDFTQFKKALTAEVEKQHLVFSEPDVSYYDLEIPCIEVEKAIKELERYAPYGEGNPRIEFKVTDYVVDAYAGVYKRLVNKGGVRLNSKNHVTAIGFGMADKMEAYEKPSKLVFYGELASNHFRGKTTPQIEFNDFEVLEEHQRVNLDDLLE